MEGGFERRWEEFFELEKDDTHCFRCQGHCPFFATNSTKSMYKQKLSNELQKSSYQMSCKNQILKSFLLVCWNKCFPLVMCSHAQGSTKMICQKRISAQQKDPYFVDRIQNWNYLTTLRIARVSLIFLWLYTVVSCSYLGQPTQYFCFHVHAIHARFSLIVSLNQPWLGFGWISMNC